MASFVPQDVLESEYLNVFARENVISLSATEPENSEGT
jgi:hypothetical protein